MRKLILSMQVSVDGYVEGPNGDLSWVSKDDPGDWADLFNLLQSVDLFLLGRMMWPEYRDYWKNVLAGAKSSANELAYAKLAQQTSHIIFSKTLKDAGWDNAVINSGEVVEEIKKLKISDGQAIEVVGGAKLAATVLEAGLVDEYRLVVNPSIVGGGKSFFRDQHAKHLLQLVDIKKLPSGNVIMRYKKETL